MVFHVVYPVYFGILTTRWSYDHHTPRFWKQKPTEKNEKWVNRIVPRILFPQIVVGDCPKISLITVNNVFS